MQRFEKPHLLCRAVRWLALAGCALALFGCDLSEVDAPEGETGSLDARLQSVLRKASSGQGTDFFLLPESGDLRALPQDPNNQLTPAKVRLGKLLFHEAQLSVHPRQAEGRFSTSCATCHHARAGFRAGRLQGLGEGGQGFGRHGEGRTERPGYAVENVDVQPIRTPSVMNAAYQDVMLWDGRMGATGANEGTAALWTKGTPKALNALGYEGLETQAIAALKTHRMSDMKASIVNTDAAYRTLFADAFPRESIEFVKQKHVGLAIAAYERTLLANEAPFQQWLRGERGAMSAAEKRGAVLFFGEAQCAGCHTGPALSSETFHALGMSDFDDTRVLGHVPESKGRAAFTNRTEDLYEFKTPQLYNLADAAFFGHGGSLTSIREVVAYKNNATPEKKDIPPYLIDRAFEPLELARPQVEDLVAFLKGGLYDPNLLRYEPDSVPSGSCIPANDSLSQAELQC